MGKEIQIYFQIREENREIYFQNQRKYFRISESADRSTSDSDFLEELPKNGENLVLLYFVGRSLF